VDLLVGLALSLTAAVVGVWGITRRDRPIHGMRDDGTLGLPKLQRWDVSYRPPRLQRLRSAVPRFEGSRLVLIIGLLIVAAVGGALAYSHSRANTVNQSSAVAQTFATIQARHAEANTVTDVATAYAILVEARARLDELDASLASNADTTRYVAERNAIEADIDRLSNAQRFQSVQVVGSAPAAAAGVTARLIAGGGRIFLLTNALYQVDNSGASLVRLLGKGDKVGDVTVGTLRGAAWRDDRPVAIDEQNAFALDPATGLWQTEPLGVFDTAGFTDVRSVEIYASNLYALAAEAGQILKFSATRYSDPPEDWTGGANQGDLQSAADIAVDGHVYALLNDGRVLDFFMARLNATLEPTLVPPLDRPVALVATANSQYLYVLNGSDGRIVRLARDGSSAQQFLPAAGAPSITDAEDFVLDETSGVAYILAHNVIYTVRVPPPAS
jgi:outer membrane protein assembly factor BamB